MSLCVWPQPAAYYLPYKSQKHTYTQVILDDNS